MISLQIDQSVESAYQITGPTDPLLMVVEVNVPFIKVTTLRVVLVSADYFHSRQRNPA